MEPEGVAPASRDQPPTKRRFVYGAIVLAFLFIAIIAFGGGPESASGLIMIVLAGSILFAATWNHFKRRGSNGGGTDGDGDSGSYDSSDGDSGGSGESSGGSDSSDSGSSSDGGSSGC